MKRFLLALLLTPCIALAQTPAPAAPKPPAITPAVPGTCTVVANALATDMRLPDCFPNFDEAKCTYFTQTPVARTVGASAADVADTKKHGQNVMNYASSQVCEGRANCGFYVLQFSSAATCDGKVEQQMPGGEYRGLTASAMRNIQMRVNKEGEAASKSGKDRGDNAKKPSNKGKVWGADE